ncbi:MAG: hypothetical protein CMI23_01995 [Opitutae bacterium]|nr:hypothetical protein [Opitutae bacterium]
MKNKLVPNFVLKVILAFYLSSCTNDQNSQNKVILAEIPDSFKFSEDLGASISVCEFRDTNDTTKDYIVEGFIGGRKNPFAENRAIFILGDNTLETCDEKSVDSCPTPWDVCCEDRKKILSSTISVQVLDVDGSIIKGSLKGVSGIDSGKKIKVRGKLNTKSTAEAIILNAEAIQILNI